MPFPATQLLEFQEQGYTILRSVHSAADMAGWRQTQDYLQETTLRSNGKLIRTNPSSVSTLESRFFWFGNMLERTPDQMWPAAANTRILEALEAIAGPFIQIDNFTLAAFPPVRPPSGSAAAASPPSTPTPAVSGWHRDRYSHLPRGHYEVPSGINAIWYLQDLTDEMGPLRVIPRSHIEPVMIAEPDRNRPHPCERLVHMSAGDVVLVHNGLCHSGTANISEGRKRYFHTVFYNMSFMRQTDTFDGPNCQLLKSLARRHNDRRALRLLGIDELLESRVNSGFQLPDQVQWARWIAEDEAARSGDMLAGMTATAEERGRL